MSGRRAFALLLGSFTVAIACSSGTPEPAAGNKPEPMDTGRECATAQTRCGGGRCTAEIDNRCKLPITCKLHIESLCQTSNGETGPANASTKDVTTLGSRTNVIEAETSCGQGTPVVTRIEGLECI